MPVDAASRQMVGSRKRYGIVKSRTIILIAASAMPFIAGCGGGGNGALTMHGTLTALGGGARGADACSWEAMPAAVAWGKVNIVSPSGAELDQAPLHRPAATGKQTSGIPVCAMRFTAAGLPSEPMYGIRINGVSDTTWVHRNRASHVTVFVGPQP